MKRFVADMEVLRAFRTDNGAKYTNSTFVDYCNGLAIRRELTASNTPRQNVPVGSGLSRAIKAGYAARLEVNKLYPDIHLETLKGVRDSDGLRLWTESVFRASEGFNRSMTTANSGMLSMHKVFFGGRMPMPVLPFCKPAYHRVPPLSITDPQARPYLFLNFGYNHGSDCFKIMDAETGRVVHSHDVTRHQRPKPLVSSAPTVGAEVPYLLFGAEAPDYVNIQPTPAATATPATAPATAAPVPASAFAAPAPAPLLTPQHQLSIALFERWSTTRTCVCLDAREARRAQ